MSIEVLTPASTSVAEHLCLSTPLVKVLYPIELVQICYIIEEITTRTEQLTGLAYQSTDFTYQMTAKK